MTSVDDMADEIMKGLTEYSELADTAMKKSSPQDCRFCQKRDLRKCSKTHRQICEKLDGEEN